MTLRWGIFFFVVAIVAALASLGAFGTAGAGEVQGQVGFAKIAMLAILAIGAAGYVGWIVFLNQKQKRGSRDMPVERPWKPDEVHHLQPESDQDREPADARASYDADADTQRPAERRPLGERPSGLR